MGTEKGQPVMIGIIAFPMTRIQGSAVVCYWLCSTEWQDSLPRVEIRPVGRPLNDVAHRGSCDSRVGACKERCELRCGVDGGKLGRGVDLGCCGGPWQLVRVFCMSRVCEGQRRVHGETIMTCLKLELI